MLKFHYYRNKLNTRWIAFSVNRISQGPRWVFYRIISGFHGVYRVGYRVVFFWLVWMNNSIEYLLISEKYVVFITESLRKLSQMTRTFWCISYSHRQQTSFILIIGKLHYGFINILCSFIFANHQWLRVSFNSKMVLLEEKRVKTIFRKRRYAVQDVLQMQSFALFKRLYMRVLS